MSSQSGLLSAFDPLSQARLRIFGFKLLILFPFATLLAVRYRYPLFNEIAMLAFWYGLFAGAVALFRWEPVAGPSLNGWDELLAFFALKCLAGSLSAVG
jgi:hypothetical protein